jgi:hypothetical protein
MSDDFEKNIEKASHCIAQFSCLFKTIALLFYNYRFVSREGNIVLEHTEDESIANILSKVF